jgi:hypothetical protein
MKTATGLILLALGAVLAFAVHGHPWFLNLQVCGWIIMAVALAGLAIPRRGYGWLRRQMVVQRGPDVQPALGIRQKRYPPYVMINPAAAAAGADGDPATMPAMPTSSDAQSWAGAQRVPDQEIAEEFFRE